MAIQIYNICCGWREISVCVLGSHQVIRLLYGMTLLWKRFFEYLQKQSTFEYLVNSKIGYIGAS